MDATPTGLDTVKQMHIARTYDAVICASKLRNNCLRVVSVKIVEVFSNMYPRTPYIYLCCFLGT